MSKIAKSIAVLGVVAGLGVAALPLSTYAEDSGPVKVQATVSSNIGITTDTDLVNMGTVFAGGAIASGSVDVTVNTSETSYKLEIIDEDTDNALNREGGPSTDTEDASKGASIAANNGAVAGATGWGWRVGNGAYAAVPKSNEAAATIVSNGTLAEKEATTKVEFGVSLASDANVADGTYSDTVIFRATAPAA